MNRRIFYLVFAGCLACQSGTEPDAQMHVFLDAIASGPAGSNPRASCRLHTSLPLPALGKTWEGVRRVELTRTVDEGSIRLAVDTVESHHTVRATRLSANEIAIILDGLVMKTFEGGYGTSSVTSGPQNDWTCDLGVPLIDGQALSATGWDTTQVLEGWWTLSPPRAVE